MAAATLSCEDLTRCVSFAAGDFIAVRGTGGGAENRILRWAGVFTPGASCPWAAVDATVPTGLREALGRCGTWCVGSTVEVADERGEHRRPALLVGLARPV